MTKIFALTILVVITMSIIIFKKESSQNLPYKSLENNASILAFGDSLTFGYGVSKRFSYPAVLQSKTGIKVINAGVNGELSQDGLKRLPKFLKQKPDLVILCHGGNDILQDLSDEQLRVNLLVMIKLIKDSGAEVLLVGVPDFNLFTFNTLSVYEEVAKESGVMFEDEILTHIESDRTLKSDYIHPNEKGYEMMADAFIKLLRENQVL